MTDRHHVDQLCDACGQVIEDVGESDERGVCRECYDDYNSSSDRKRVETCDVRFVVIGNGKERLVLRNTKYPGVEHNLIMKGGYVYRELKEDGKILSEGYLEEFDFVQGILYGLKSGLLEEVK